MASLVITNMAWPQNGRPPRRAFTNLQPWHIVKRKYNTSADTHTQSKLVVAWLCR